MILKKGYLAELRGDTNERTNGAFIPLVNWGASSPQLRNNPQFPNLFSLQASDADLMSQMAELLQKVLGYKKIVVVYTPADQWSTYTHSHLVSEWKAKYPVNFPGDTNAATSVTVFVE